MLGLIQKITKTLTMKHRSGLKNDITVPVREMSMPSLITEEHMVNQI